MTQTQESFTVTYSLELVTSPGVITCTDDNVTEQTGHVTAQTDHVTTVAMTTDHMISDAWSSVVTSAWLNETMDDWTTTATALWSNTSDVITTDNTTAVNSTCGHITSNYMPTALKVVLGILVILMVFMSMLGNSIVCLIVYQKPSMRSAINLLLANMAFSNIMLAVLCMPFALVTLMTDAWLFGFLGCQFLAFAHKLFICEAILILLTISVDRYLIIVQRKDKLTPYRAKLFIVLTWFVSFLVSFPPIIGWGQYHYYTGWMLCNEGIDYKTADLAYLIFAMTVTFYLPMLVMTYCFISITNRVRHNQSRVHVQRPIDGLTISQIGKLGLVGPNQTNWVNADMSFKTRAFKTVLILYLLSLVCWTPYAICMLDWNLNDSLAKHYLVGSILLCLGYMNSALNPVIYCLRIKKFREAVSEIIPKSLKLWPNLPERSKRRVNPSAIYECNEQTAV